MNKYELHDCFVSQLRGEDFSEHIKKHFMSLEEAQKIVALSGRSFSVFNERLSKDVVLLALENYLNDADNLFEKILEQKADVKAYVVKFNRKGCGTTVLSAGRPVEKDSFRFYFRVYRNVDRGEVKFDVELSTVFPK